MKMTVNGREVDVPENVRTVRDLLDHFGLNKDLAIVELNQSILDKTTRDDQKLANGDRVEIVQFVGGG
ncbi:sulfur carrier protein ThiS [Domibacillus indicus]|uniref:sulfur carrier protein ThiS n=1 Tax=Domibacillus TaxID=1433999 RepID=UPI00203D2F4D|nr:MULTISPECIES: sulfur carrier protein ThiS [Domibacillus]MCM3790433.1 sulfur carrier protein ThiS [Domibacillus indicus]WNS80445.1 sulfur carrier protein ThiS [Domibacillus sp. DTU_2020_1001157_1_SI_ALB_TIR_016]